MAPSIDCVSLRQWMRRKYGSQVEQVIEHVLIQCPRWFQGLRYLLNLLNGRLSMLTYCRSTQRYIIILGVVTSCALTDNLLML